MIDLSLRWQVVEGDCLDVMRELPDGCVDAVVTDPPYGVKYNDLAWDVDLPSQSTLNDCLRLSRGPVVWVGASVRLLDFALYVPRPDRTMVWHVTFSNTMTRNQGIFHRWHPIFVWRNGGALDGKNARSDVFSVPTEGRHAWDHPATKPVELMRQLCGLLPADSLILDPYCGSGTTGVAAVQLGHRFVGIEREPQYVAIARQRIADAAAQGNLFDGATP